MSALRPFRLAMLQMEVRGGDKPANVRRALERIATAADHGADVVLLPECLDLGWTHPSSRAQAEPVPDGGVCAALRDAARRHSLIVCAGLTERDGDRVYNAAVLIDSHGELLLRHRKIHELDIAHDVYDQGDRLNVASTPLGTIGVLIRADACAPDRVLARSLGRMGADLILSPCAWAVSPAFDNDAEPYGQLWRDVYTATAREFGCAVVGVSNVGPVDGGPWDGWRCIGCSLAVDPHGQIVRHAR